MLRGGPATTACGHCRCGVCQKCSQFVRLKYDSWPQVHWERAHEIDEEFKRGSEIIGEYLFHSNGSCDAATEALHALMCRANDEWSYD